MPGVSLYIHVPFCRRRCGYCDFNTYAGLQGLIPAYVEAVRNELEFISISVTNPLTISTVYFGGGTPSLLKDYELISILDTIQKYFDLSSDAEITLEANPGTVEKEQLVNIHQAGITRLSLGMQSAIPDELTMLERQHTFQDVIQAVEWAREAGIDNLNLDLIFGLPNQDVRAWIKSVQAALSLLPEHLSMYALTIEHGTPMQHKVENGSLPEPDADLAADMYEAASELIAAAGYAQYEISNWARGAQTREQYSCRHNLQYWRNLPYIGVGAGAHGYINNYRTVDALTPGEFIRRMDKSNSRYREPTFPTTPATIQSIYIDRDTEIGETMMMGLRLVDEGVSNQDFYQRFGQTLLERFGRQIDHFISIGLLEWTGSESERIRLTPKGYLLGNQVFVDFI